MEEFIDSIKAQLVFMLLFSTANVGIGQNLIVNGSFEDMDCPDNTIASFYESEFWNATGADAYWMHSKCEVDPFDIQSIFAINTSIIPYDGSGYISLEALIFNNGYCLSEGVSQQLVRPLKEGSFYYLELGTLKYGLENPFTVVPDECHSFPNRGIELRLDHQHIRFEYDSKSVDAQPMICSSTTSSQVIFDDIHIEDFLSSATSWNFYWNCFKAEEDFEYFSITGPNKFFDELNSCMEEGKPGIQHLSGYAVDNVKLYEIPFALDTTLALCTGSANFSISDLIDAPFVDKAILSWEDGAVGGERVFNSPGEYILEMEFPCHTVKVQVEVIDENCDVKVIVPNVISTRESSPNNLAKPYLYSDFIIENYQWSIYDRWGGLVFSSRDFNDFWDGTNDGKSLESGVYVWKLNYSINNNAVKEELLGTITLLK